MASRASRSCRQLACVWRRGGGPGGLPVAGSISTTLRVEAELDAAPEAAERQPGPPARVEGDVRIDRVPVVVRGRLDDRAMVLPAVVGAARVERDIRRQPDRRAVPAEGGVRVVPGGPA